MAPLRLNKIYNVFLALQFVLAAGTISHLVEIRERCTLYGPLPEYAFGEIVPIFIFQNTHANSRLMHCPCQQGDFPCSQRQLVENCPSLI